MYESVYKGKYVIKNPTKYRGDIDNIVYRSSWELKFMNMCDNNDSILEWGSEIIVIPYISPVDNKPHRYFVDFYIKVKNKENIIEKYLIEVKPKKFTLEPQKPKRVTKHFINEVYTYGINQAKWAAAKKFCEHHGWKFIILTEDELKV